MKNKGSATLEASLIIPIFLFFMWGMINILWFFIADAHIHQSLCESSKYGAQCAYLNENLVYPAIITKFHTYLGDDFCVNKTIAGGKNGIVITYKTDDNDPYVFTAKANYAFTANIPVLGNHFIYAHDEVKQKMYVGFDSNNEEVDEYVYVTPNEAVYHTSRMCTHLSLSYASVGSNTSAYKPCRICGKFEPANGNYYVSRTNNICHSTAGCSGLKRTVTRVKKSSVPGLAPCSRCGR